MNARLLRCFPIVFVLVGAATAGCSKREAPMSAAPSPVVMAAASAQADSVSAIPKANRALIVTVDMSLRVTDVTDATRSIRSAAEDAGGYISNSSASDTTASMDLRVPADKVAGLRSKLGEIGDIDHQNEKVDDVTEQRADLDARLHNARTEEARFLEIMQQKTGSITDVISAEKELARVRETIELLEAQKRTLEGQIAMATIHLSLNAPSTAARQTPGRSISLAFEGGVKTAEALAIYGAMAIAASSPILVPILSLAAIAYVLVKRRRRLATA